MKVVLATAGRFHVFPLARELEHLGHLERIYSGFPWTRLAREGVSRGKVTTFPYVRPLLMGMRYLPFAVPEAVADGIHQLSLVTLDRYVTRTMPDCDVYVGHEGVGLVSGAAAQRRGALYVCDRGCSHMAWRERIIASEHERLGLPLQRQPNTYQREIDEYSLADLVVVPSEFARESFVAEGLPADKVAVVPYGVDLTRFKPVDRPPEDHFNVIFVGQVTSRKGVGDLLKAFRMAAIDGKRLTIVGEIDPALRALYAGQLGAEDVECLGHVSHHRLAEFYSRAHVFCLPSIEDGWGMVVTEAMACGCPPIVSAGTGARSIVRDGENGYVVPIRSPETIARHLETLAANRELRDQLGAAALASVRDLKGWKHYGRTAVGAYQQALTKRSTT